jgi:hypothetical protein
MAVETPAASPRCCRIARAAPSDIGRIFVDAGSIAGVKIDVSTPPKDSGGRCSG